MEEIWKDIAGYEGKYQVSNLGNVKSTVRCVSKDYVILKPRIHTGGYVRVTLPVPAGRVDRYIHRLVAQAFIENPNNEQYVNHIDGDKKNNAVVNLEWVNKRENINHYIQNCKVKTSRYTGVSLENNCWSAVLYIGKQAFYLGGYKTEDQAAIAYKSEFIKRGIANRYAVLIP